MNFRTLLFRSAIVFLVLIAAYFLLRNAVLHWAFSRIQVRVEKTYNLNLETADLHFSGFDCLNFTNLVLKPDRADTLLIIKELICNISLRDLFRGKIAFDELRADGSTITIYNLPDKNNLKFLVRNQPQEQSPASVNDYREKRKAWKQKFFSILNTACYLKDVRISYIDSTQEENIYIPNYTYDLQNISALVINLNSDDSIYLKGSVSEKKESFQFSAYHRSDPIAYIPFLDRERGLKCKFQSLSSTFSVKEHSDQLEISAEINSTDFVLNHWRVARNDVHFPRIEFAGTWRISDASIEVDSGSVVKLGNVPFKLFAKYSVKPYVAFALDVHMPETISDTAFHALPGGIFQTLKGISCTGTLAFDMQFYLDSQQPDSLYFNMSLNRKNFRLNHFGEENFTRINEPFIYNAFDKERFVRQIKVGSENPMFTPINRMSDYLPKAVLQSEDPSFMQHRGFLPEAFRESIIQNYKEKRFARGGSTISMQLVKNIFLNRDKTISRKAEEALIVYLIENLNLVSKERMFEIYLNVIEWGPNVYGIGEAALFYFNKKPSELSLEESIFLSSLIPAPKYFKYRFDKQGHLSPSMYGYFRILISRMAGKGWISSSDTTGLRPQVRLRGPAQNLILPVDSLRIEEEGDF